MLHKPHVVSSQTKKAPYFSDLSRLLPVNDGFNFFGIQKNNIPRNYISKEDYFIKLELKFGKLSIELFNSQSLQDNLKVIRMFFYIP